ncbi:MAG: DUF484 family protein [Gammaproteobacteria bacterium]|jgi:hypothetical protein
MSSQPTSKAVIDHPGEEEVARFLAQDPEFFLRHPELLNQIRLPHHNGGGTVSLVERQLDVLRAKNRKLEKRLKDLVGVARSNHQLSDKVHRLSLELIGADGLDEVIARLELALREDLGGHESVVVLFHDPSTIVQAADTRFLRRVERSNPGLKPFATFIERGQPRCGRARDAQLEFLFPEHADEIGSIALVPLGPNAQVGMLAIGSHDPDRFHPGMSTDFLERIGDLIGVAVAARGA